VEWRYTLEKPADNWTNPAFNDTWWNTDSAGFGAEGTPGADGAHQVGDARDLDAQELNLSVTTQ